MNLEINEMKEKRARNESEAIAYYTSYSAKLGVSSSQWQLDAFEMSGLIDTLEDMVHKHYPDKVIADYILFVSRNKKQYFYLDYVYRKLKGGK